MMYRSVVISFILAVVTMSWPQPASALEPTGVFQGIDSSTAIASGSATDADRPGQSIAVDFFLGNSFSTYVGGSVTQVSSGAFMFQIPEQYRDGVSRTFCAWAINDAEPHVALGCKDFAQANRPPTGTLVSIDGSTGIASGSASDPDRPGQSILVDFWLGPGLNLYLGQAATGASSGAFTYQVPAQYLDGQSHTICAWAINEVAPHTEIGCKTLAPPDSAATGSLSVIAASNYTASGTASDPDEPSVSIKVELRLGASPVAYALTSNGAFQIQIPEQYRDGQPREFCAFAFSNRPIAEAANIGCKVYQNQLPGGSIAAFDANGGTKGSVSDPDSPGAEVDVHFYAERTFANYLGKTRTVGGKFSFRISSDKRASGEVCAYAINLQGGTNPLLGCSSYVKPGLQYYGYFTSSTPFRLGQGDYTNAVTNHANLAWIESNDCNVLARGYEDLRYCDDHTRDEPAYYANLTTSQPARTIDFYDLIARLRVAKQAGDKAVIHLEQFLFVYPKNWVPEVECFYLRDDADELIEKLSRLLKLHELMDTVEVVYPIDEPYLKAVVDPSTVYPYKPVNERVGADKGVCASTADKQPLENGSARAAEIYGVLSQVLASIRANDSVSGQPRFPGKKTAAIFSFKELTWSDALVKIPAEYDWVGYDGYIATGEYEQDYTNTGSNYLGILQRKLATLPNAASKRIMLVPEAFVPDTSVPDYAKYIESFYETDEKVSPQCESDTMRDFIAFNDEHREAECVVLSNFIKAYRRALCDPRVVAIVPFLWQEGINKYVPLKDSVPLEDMADRYRDLTNYLAVATMVGQGISAANATDGLYALPDVSCGTVMQPMPMQTTSMQASMSATTDTTSAKRVSPTHARGAARTWGSLAVVLLVGMVGFGAFRLGGFRARGLLG